MNSAETGQRPPLTPPMLHDVDYYKKEGIYFYLEATRELLPNGRVDVINYGEMIMLGSYSYLGLIGHPKINEAAKAAIDKYGTGTHGVRLLAGSLDLHNQLEERIAKFKKTDGAITYSSGYATNLATISSLLRKGDTVISDKLNHASIVNERPEIAACRFVDLVYRITHSRFIGEVEAQGLFRAGLCRSLGAFGSIGTGDDIRAFFGEFPHHAQANARVATCDHHPAIVHLHPGAFLDRAKNPSHHQ